MRILVDCHEVLADFTTAALKIHGYTREQFEKLPGYTPGARDLAKQLGISKGEFWFPINRAGAPFWRGLAVLPNAIALLEHVISLTNDWHIVSTPSRHSSSYAGIRQWVQFHIDENFSRLVLMQDKHLLANPNTILIDDSEDNIREFATAGGNGFLFPAWHNQLRGVEDPLVFTIDRLDEFLLTANIGE